MWYFGIPYIRFKWTSCYSKTHHVTHIFPFYTEHCILCERMHLFSKYISLWNALSRASENSKLYFESFINESAYYYFFHRHCNFYYRSINVNIYAVKQSFIFYRLLSLRASPCKPLLATEMIPKVANLYWDSAF